MVLINPPATLFGPRIFLRVLRNTCDRRGKVGAALSRPEARVA